MIIQISAQIYPCWCTITLYKPIFSRPRLALTLLHIYIFYDSWPTPQRLSNFYSLHPIACSCSLHPSLDCVGANNDNTPLPGWGYCLPTLSMCDKWGKEITPFLRHFFVKRRRRERENRTTTRKTKKPIFVQFRTKDIRLDALSHHTNHLFRRLVLAGLIFFANTSLLIHNQPLNDSPIFLPSSSCLFLLFASILKLCLEVEKFETPLPGWGYRPCHSLAVLWTR